MNPYDVLGVRPSASTEEIELAYRSRRTQYHPDKYAQQDAETIQWATGRMQEVNLAYQALRDGYQQAPSGASSGSKSRAPGSQRQSTQQPEESVDRPSLARVVAQHAQRFAQASRVYPAPNIPLQKLHAALQSYGGGIQPQDVLLLTDSTVFGGAKEGILLTEKRIRGKGFGDALQDFQWRDITHVELKDTDLWINGAKFAEGMRAERWEMLKLLELITTFLAAFQAGGHVADHDADETAQNWSPQDKARLLLLARERIVELSDFVERLEEESGETLLDLNAAVEFFDDAEEAIDDPEFQESVLVSLVTVLEIYKSARLVAKDLNSQIHPSLWHAHQDDPMFVRSLKHLLKRLMQMRPELRKSPDLRELFP